MGERGEERLRYRIVGVHRIVMDIVTGTRLRDVVRISASVRPGGGRGGEIALGGVGDGRGGQHVVGRGGLYSPLHSIEVTPGGVLMPGANHR